MSEEQAVQESVEAPAVNESTNTSDGKWYDSLPEDMRQDKNITKFDSVESMSKSWLSAQRMIGKDKIPMPETDEDYATVYGRLGRPDDVSGYEIKAPEGVQVDTDKQASFLDVAHKAGLSKKQVEVLSTWDFEHSSKTMESFNANTESANKESLESLKTEWGPGFDKNVKIANRAVNEFVNESELSFLKEKSIDGIKLADHPVLVRMFSNIGKGMMEGGNLEGVGAEQGMTPQEMKDSRSTLMNHPAYTDKRHAEHEQVHRKVRQSFEEQYN
ncbi:MAG: hypothetical protein V3U78_04645 [Thiotrichaceae bacterium]